MQVTSLKFKEQAGHKSVEIILFPDCYPRVSIDALAEEQEENLVGRMHSSIHHSSPSQPHTHTHTHKWRICHKNLSELITIMPKSLTPQQQVVVRVSICCSVNPQLNPALWWGRRGFLILASYWRLKQPIKEFNLLSGSCSYNSCTTVVLAASVAGFMTVGTDTSEIPVSHKRCLKNLQGVCLNLVLISSNFSSVTNQWLYSFLYCPMCIIHIGISTK